MKLGGLLLIALVFLCLPGSALAHTTGVSKEVPIGKYIVDTGYDPAAPRAGDRLLLDLNLLDATTKERLPFTSVWVRLVDSAKRTTLLATGVQYATIGPTTVLWEVPAEVVGPLTVSLRFEGRDSTMAEVSFDLPLEQSASALQSQIFIAVGVVGVCIALGAAYLAGRFLGRRPVI